VYRDGDDGRLLGDRRGALGDGYVEHPVPAGKPIRECLVGTLFSVLFVDCSVFQSASERLKRAVLLVTDFFVEFCVFQSPSESLRRSALLVNEFSSRGNGQLSTELPTKLWAEGCLYVNPVSIKLLKNVRKAVGAPFRAELYTQHLYRKPEATFGQRFGCWAENRPLIQDLIVLRLGSRTLLPSEIVGKMASWTTVLLTRVSRPLTPLDHANPIRSSLQPL
jgi:hypothetical protein